MTAAALRSLPPRSKPMRQPSRWRPSGWLCARSGGRSLRVHDFERVVEHFFADHVRVELARGVVAVMRGKLRGEGWPGRRNKSASRRATRAGTSRSVRGRCNCQRRAANFRGRSPCGSDKTEPSACSRAMRTGSGLPDCRDLLAKRAIGQHGRTELRVQRRRDARRDQLQSVVVVHSGSRCNSGGGQVQARKKLIEVNFSRSLLR